MKNINLYIILLLVFTACIKKDDTLFENVQNSDNIEDLKVSSSFDFATSKTIALTIKDYIGDGIVRYDIYTHGEGSQLLASGTTVNNIFSIEMTVSSYLEKIDIIRKHNGKTLTSTYSITNNQVQIDFSKGNAKVASSGTFCYEKLFAVNNQSGFYMVNAESGNYEEESLGTLQGGGSIASAVDRSNKICYYNTGSTLYTYNIETGVYTALHNSNPFGGSYPRLEFDNSTGLCYMAKNEIMYKVNPITNETLQKYDIVGLESPVSGGDIAISLDGTMYMCCFSGLYRIALNGNIANATRISAEDLPFSPTSMAIDRNDNLYLATNDANAQLIIMDKFDGAWDVVQTYSHTINDLGSLPCLQSELSDADSDGDGIIDVNDDYPNDADKAFNVYTPSQLGWGSLGFEDLWPAQGDYDFNDLVMNYRVIAIANSQNQVVELQVLAKVAAIGASYKNGFGIEFPFSSDIVSEVTGTNLTENMISLNANGTEANQDKAVVIVFDNAFKNGNYGECATQSEDNLLTIVIKFTSPQELSTIGSAPFNPFIFVETRNHEIHLKNQSPTNLMNMDLFGTLHDASDNNTYYTNQQGLPWGINIVHNFRPMKESRQITTGYMKFFQWSSSEGSQYTDWYKDNSGYRAESNICIE